MKNKNVKTVKGLVKQLRSIRDKANAELQNLTSEQRTEYFKKMRERNHSPEQQMLK